MSWANSGADHASAAGRAERDFTARPGMRRHNGAPPAFARVSAATSAHKFPGI
ncbi:hypothetical protein HOY34_15195 [Xinfangfangia sp. D13-10-4-6]|uniref:hypothetical protein n=1 Tax=Pseudogemmobacter hezensis TaxID=2737662 RepID=UPI001557472D|nr:hypothetical protein [Pseudogemmobacter hezensis]NPD16536.1 hypothetical protein [Pseudogemmobacter hezensis]